MQTMVSQRLSQAPWRILDLSYDSAFQNLAFEEALVRSDSNLAHTARVWVNPPAVIVGRFQDVKSEIDLELCERNNIQIARRFTGGGAVYHDAGTLNFTIVKPTRPNLPLLESYKLNASIVQNCLTLLGLNSEFVAPNSIEVSGRKICGAAAGVTRDYSLWHSSILVSTDLEILRRVLMPSRVSYGSSYIRSNWKPVVNLNDALGRNLSMAQVKESLLLSVEKISGAKPQLMQPTQAELGQMHALLNDKYSTYNWNHQGTPSAAQI